MLKEFALSTFESAAKIVCITVAVGFVFATANGVFKHACGKNPFDAVASGSSFICKKVSSVAKKAYGSIKGTLSSDEAPSDSSATESSVNNETSVAQSVVQSETKVENKVAAPN